MFFFYINLLGMALSVCGVCCVVSVCVLSPIQCRLSGGQMTPCIITIIQERIANQRANNAAL